MKVHDTRRFVMAAMILASCVSVLGTASAFGTTNSTCALATPLGPGVYPGLILYDDYIHPPATYYTDYDWYQFTVPPGQRLTVAVGVTSATAPSGYYLWTWIHEGCAAAQLDTGTVVNTGPTPKVFTFEAWVWSIGANDAFVTYTLYVSMTPEVAGVSYCPGAPNSVGSGGTLAVSGTNSVAANNLVFNAANMPPNGFALIAAGTTQTSAPFGDGTLCIAGSLQRLYVVPVSGTGTCTAALDIPNLPPSATIVAGDLRYFQLYYRDSAGPLGTGFNLTNAMAVAFTP
jgi:hypothetical protein